MRYGFIGLGNMGSAIIKGMIRAQLTAPENILGYSASGNTGRVLAEELGITACGSLKDALAAEVVVLAVKPHILGGALASIGKQGIDLKRKLFISIAAGKSLDVLREGLGDDIPVVRVMPNINAKVGAATCAFAAAPGVLQEEKAVVRNMFESTGTIMELPEELFPVFTSIAGCGPAFCYMFMDALARAGVRRGMSRKQSLEAAASTLMGSAKMILESGEHPFALVDQVSSPGGTTVEGVCALQEHGFEKAIHAAVEACVIKDAKL